VHRSLVGLSFLGQKMFDRYHFFLAYRQKAIIYLTCAPVFTKNKQDSTRYV
jgi:hypothetical protein